eukprot:TRINITY_DN3023_c0_g1_i2.p1 TRINITY_DN3023_c0_g1~~TRINITY_DN3023_c0_g1_i2.p1  ORF type:complete len:338 (+),score=76.67 TRINITY_DN3023_c0_g1_i2:809-1822(+)
MPSTLPPTPVPPTPVQSAENPEKSAGLPVTFPDDLYDLGVELFGSESAFQEFAAGLTKPRMVPFPAGKPQLQIKLLADNNDNTLARPPEYPARAFDDLQDGEVVTDIGTNIGDFCIGVFLARRAKGVAVRVLAGEPVPPTYFIFRLNMYLNDVPALSAAEFETMPPGGGIYPFFGAVGAADGEMIVAYSRKSTQNAATYPAGTPPKDLPSAFKPAEMKWREKTVPMLDVYRALAPLGKVGLFKIDCEGCEFVTLPESVGRLDLTSKETVRHFTAEIHWNSADPKRRQGGAKGKDSIAANVNSDESWRAVDKLLRNRGCPGKPTGGRNNGFEVNIMTC